MIPYDIVFISLCIDRYLEDHEFPVRVQSDGGELLTSVNGRLFDTVISVNVLEHVQNAFAYLTGLVSVLKPGGLLMLHEVGY